MEDTDLKQLKDYAVLDNSSLGNYCTVLCHLAEFIEDHATEDFMFAVRDEITKQLLNYKYNTNIKEEVYTHVETVRTLEWK